MPMEISLWKRLTELKGWICTFWVHVLLLMIQIAFFMGTIAWIAWISMKHPHVPSSLSYLYIKHNQSSATVLTFFGTLLSSVTIYPLAKVIQFSINISLRHKGISLTKVQALQSKSPVLDQGKGWLIISLFFSSIFLAQTAAWTTIITPKLGPSKPTTGGKFNDFDFSTPLLENGVLPTLTIPLSPFLSSSGSGMAAVQNMVVATGLLDSATSNISRLLPFGDFVFNGTSFGIMPQIPSSLDSVDWTNVTAIQQGLTANVTCVQGTKLDPAVNAVSVNMNAFGMTYRATSLSCANKTASYNSSGPYVMDTGAKISGVFAICNNVGHTIPLYVQIGGAWLVDEPGDTVAVNMTCSIQLQILDVMVAYSGGNTETVIVNIDPRWETSRSPSVDTSAIVSTVMADLGYHLSTSQSPDMNLIIETVYDLAVSNNLPIDALMAGYVRGVIEYAATASRVNVLFNLTDAWNQVPGHSINVEMSQTVASWGPASPSYKMVVVVSPLAIMLSTIVIFLDSLCRAQGLPDSKRENMMSLDLTSISDVLYAYSIGIVKPLRYYSPVENVVSVKPEHVQLSLRSTDMGECLDVKETKTGEHPVEPGEHFNAEGIEMERLPPPVGREYSNTRDYRSIPPPRNRN